MLADLHQPSRPPRGGRGNPGSEHADTNTRLAALELLDGGLEPHDVGQVYLASPDRPTHWVPLAEQDLDRKIAAMRAHVSQVGNWDMEGMLRGFAATAAGEARANGVECELTEAFVYIALRGGATEV